MEVRLRGCPLSGAVMGSALLSDAGFGCMVAGFEIGSEMGHVAGISNIERRIICIKPLLVAEKTIGCEDLPPRVKVLSLSRMVHQLRQ
jgi:hypothetical protein